MTEEYVSECDTHGDYAWKMNCEKWDFKTSSCQNSFPQTTHAPV